MTSRRRLLWTSLLLSSSAASSTAATDVERRKRLLEGRGGGMRRRKRPQQHDQNRLPGHTIRHDPKAPYHPTYRRLSTGDDCAANEQPFVLSFQTDNYGSETSWFLHSPSTGLDIGYGPAPGMSYGDFTLYTFSYCLTIGSTYTLAMEDNFGDGMCCARGYGGYEYSIGGVRVYSTNFTPTFHDYVEHTFTIEGQYSPAPTSTPTEPPQMECVADPTNCGCEDVAHEDYRGDLSVTEDGYTCQHWNVQFPHVHDYSPTLYPNMDMNNNYCRAPDGGTPWCFTADHKVQWGFCRVPTCPQQLVGSGGSSSTVVGGDNANDTGGNGVGDQTNNNVGVGNVKNPTESSVESTTPTYTPTEITQFPTYSPEAGPTTSRPTTVGPTPLPSHHPTHPPTFYPTKSPTPYPTFHPTSRPTHDYSVLNTVTGCYGGDSHILIEARADEYSTDTSWDLYAPNGTRILHQAAGTFDVMEYKSSTICVPHGNYTFVIKDEYGDGMCCRYGEGFFKVHVDGREVLNGGSYNENVTVTLNVGFNPEGVMTERDHLYLEAHNRRRKEWHERYNLTYVPMVHSPALAAQSKAWAEELLYSCAIVGIEHENQNPFGENLAKNTGNPETWGRLYPPDNIVGRWVEFEIGLPYPSNGHLTQCLWRASKYLGCGEAMKPFRNGVCRVQVCRYGRAGNCDMKRFNSTQGENWLVPMLDNYTRCGPDCPPEGCF